MLLSFFNEGNKRRNQTKEISRPHTLSLDHVGGHKALAARPAAGRVVEHVVDAAGVGWGGREGWARGECKERWWGDGCRAQRGTLQGCGGEERRWVGWVGLGGWARGECKCSGTKHLAHSAAPAAEATSSSRGNQQQGRRSRAGAAGSLEVGVLLRQLVQLSAQQDVILCRAAVSSN